MNALSLAIWIVVICFFISFTMAFYRMFVENQSQFLGLMNLFPQNVFEFKGISNFDDLLSVMGFYAANNTIYMQLLGSIYAIVLSSGILLKEEYNKTADYLLSRPLTRSDVFITKTVLVVVNITLLNAIVMLAGYISIEMVKTDQYSLHSYIILSIYTFFLNLTFGFTGLLISTLVKRAKPITTLGIGIVLFLYFLFSISKITASAEKLGYISPFRYVDVNVLNQDYGLDPWNTMYFCCIIVFMAIAAFLKYRKKDIYV